MTMKIIVSLSDRQATLETVGGKGASLVRLFAAGLPVPDGFIVSTEAYWQFVAENGLREDILRALESVDLSRPSTLEEASQRIQARFLEAQTPPEIASAIVHAYATLPGQNPAVAVRSSATAEDLPEASFAGQQETYLNVSSPDAVLEATKKCWASLWTARAIGYRARQGISPDGVALAVVVQLLVPAEVAGIMFTADPVTGQRDRVVLNASWGLGEAVVGGVVTPDSLTVDKGSGQVSARQTADKQVMTVCVNGGTQEQPVPESLRQVPVLGDEAAAELARLGVQIERLYQAPMDIEWTLADGRFAIVQARPITALPPAAPLPEPAAAPPTGPSFRAQRPSFRAHMDVPIHGISLEWKLPNPKGKYLRGSIVDYMPDPLTPLFGDMGPSVLTANMRRVIGEMLGTPDMVPADYVVTINDYPYINGAVTGRQGCLMLTRMAPKLPYMMRTTVARWRGQALPRYAEAVARWQQKPPQALAAAECLAGAREILDAAAYLVATLQTGPLGAAAGSETLFTAFYDKMVRREGDPPAPTYLLGFDSAPILAEKALFDLAGWCREHPALATYLADSPTPRLITGWTGEQAPPGVDTDCWREWQRRFRAHLDQYGHSIYDLDFAKPLAADDPTAVLEALKMYVRGQGTDPYERQQGLAGRREAAVAAVEGRTGGLKRKVFRKLLGWAQRLGPQREDGIADIGLGYPLLRRLLRELGGRLAEAGAIEQPDDIFWLRAEEAETAAATLDRGQAPGSMVAAVRQRKAEWQARKRVVPPPLLPLSKKYMGISMEGWLPVGADEQASDTLKGLGCSPGRVTATARVLRGPEDFGQMQPGDVLVAVLTTPAWTPLFAMASGVVTDVGGTLSHGSIVAREYGIPAVLGTGVATRRIHSGQTITVDGTAGEVHLA